MKKTTIALSLVAALSTSSFGAKLTHDDLQSQIEALKAQIALLESKVNEAAQTKPEPAVLKLPEDAEKRLATVEKKVATNYTKINEVKAHDANDNIKFDVDFRTQYDNIQYKLSGGGKAENDALMTNRLELGMGFSPNDNTIFKGILSYNKVFGANTASSPYVGGLNNNSNFDWITNSSATDDNALNVKEAYWLYMDDKLYGADIPWTVSVGRRPSTDGLGINLRADQERKSALSHTVNVEFDGASAKFTLDKLTGVEGMWLKFCAGRGLTNAKLRFSEDGLDFTDNPATTSNIDMAGFIFVPYDNGQYSVHTNYAKAWNLIGYADTNNDGIADTGQFEEFGNIELATIMFKADGIGNEISDYLDNTIAFASFAMSKTSPNNGQNMLGSPNSETGHSIWLGVNAPCPIDPEESRIGVEWNKGSKYWRSMTYGEDTMVGSKVAARGTAWEIYRNSKINNALSWTLRYTKIDYDYTGSNGFFGDMGAPNDIDSVTGAVKEAQNITANVRYRF